MKNYIGSAKFTPKLMPIHAPNINSYRRLFATWDAPRNTNWGLVIDLVDLEFLLMKNIV